MKKQDKQDNKFIPPRNKNDLTAMLANLIQKKRVGVFIDSANLYYAAGKANLKIDYFQIAKWFHKHAESVELNFYTAFDPADQKQQDFFTDLENAGYRLIKKPIKVFADSVKGNMDIELAVDSLIKKDEYDSLVLVSGDGDFHYLVKALEQLGKKTIILGVGGFTSYELHQEADNYFFLNRISHVWRKTDKRQKAQAHILENLSSTQSTTNSNPKPTPKPTLKVKVKLNRTPKIFAA